MSEKDFEKVALEPRTKKKRPAVGKLGTGQRDGWQCVPGRAGKGGGAQGRAQQSVEGGQGGELWQCRGQRPDKGTGRQGAGVQVLADGPDVIRSMLWEICVEKR